MKAKQLWLRSSMLLWHGTLLLLSVGPQPHRRYAPPRLVTSSPEVGPPDEGITARPSRRARAGFMLLCITAATHRPHRTSSLTSNVLRSRCSSCRCQEVAATAAHRLFESGC